MKILNTRLICLTVIALMSMGSYVFLRSVNVTSEATLQGSNVELELQENLQDEASAETETLLPDVQLLKFVIKTGKRFLPAS
jgi:hypothetical protein